jgi:hypothetical protein
VAEATAEAVEAEARVAHVEETNAKNAHKRARIAAGLPPSLHHDDTPQSNYREQVMVMLTKGQIPLELSAARFKASRNRKAAAKRVQAVTDTAQAEAAAKAGVRVAAAAQVNLPLPPV